MNRQSKDGNISWTDYTWNPIKGLCPVGCWYCYARAMYKRFKLDEDLRLHLVERLAPRFIKKPAKIFVCSTIEIFHPRISAKWRDMIFSIINQCPQHTFQILTKMPENIDRHMPDNVWLGVSAGDDLKKSAERMRNFSKYIMQNEGFYFLSLEPLIYGDISYCSFENVFPLFGWIIVGRLTGHGKRYDPPRKYIEGIVDNCQELQIPIFLKNNLKEIWGEKLIQKWPQC